MSRKQKKNSDSEKLDLILSGVAEINHKVDKQNEQLAQLQKEVKALEEQVNEMARKNRRAAVVAGGLGGGLVALGFELMKLKFGG